MRPNHTQNPKCIPFFRISLIIRTLCTCSQGLRKNQDFWYNQKRCEFRKEAIHIIILSIFSVLITWSHDLFRTYLRSSDPAMEVGLLKSKLSCTELLRGRPFEFVICPNVNWDLRIWLFRLLARFPCREWTDLFLGLCNFCRGQNRSGTIRLTCLKFP